MGGPHKKIPVGGKGFNGSIHPRAWDMPFRTPLYDSHEAAGAAFIEFGGWEMPLRFSGIVVEHTAVRRGAGVFDVSHMGKILVVGDGAWGSLNRLSTNDIPRKPYRARYTHLLTEEGFIIDDVIVTCLTPDLFLVVCNAGPRERVLAWLLKHAIGVRIRDVTFDHLCLALQGPKAARVLQLLTPYDVSLIKPFTGAYANLLLGERIGTGRPPMTPPSETVGRAPFAGDPSQEVEDYCFVTRTGYTGEDGFELLPPKELAVPLWSALFAAGQETGLLPIGLGARDTLRLEKGFLLSGTDFDGRQTSLECASEWLVKWDHDFVGRDALIRQKERGDFDRLVGVLLQDRGVPRHGCTVLHKGVEVGTVTSGTMSPSLKVGVALARVRPEAAEEGTSVEVVVRDSPLRATVKKPPFL